jgi:hypothetical protein
MPLTAHEFEVLKTWVETKINVGFKMVGRELDKPYVESLLRDAAAADDAARVGLVVDFAPQSIADHRAARAMEAESTSSSE